MTSLVLVGVALAIGVALFGRPRRLTDRAPSSGRRVRIVIPCRNGEATLGLLLDDLRRCHRPEWEIVVVDDSSTDATAAISRASAVATTVGAPGPPDGWCGKPWACAVGAEHGDRPDDGDVVVFLDADVRLAPGAIDAVLAERDASGGVVSVQPFHTVPTAAEQLSAVPNIVAVMGIGASTDRPVGMFGPVVCCTMGDYRRVGGHGAVRDRIVEDVALARVFVDAGVGVRTFVGDRRLAFRMYPEGLSTLVEGWTKNLSIGASASPLPRRLGVAGWITALLTAPTLPFRLDDAGVPLAAGGYAVAAASVWWMLRRLGTFRWWVAATFPLFVAFFVAMVVRSAWHVHVRRRVVWRSREIVPAAVRE